uniref:Uncharacterized protein n=1 Tax=Glossina palpalis gambiensis TaxID=67801 RepID=A0A1B0C6V7_9MUSC
MIKPADDIWEVNSSNEIATITPQRCQDTTLLLHLVSSQIAFVKRSQSYHVYRPIGADFLNKYVLLIDIKRKRLTTLSDAIAHICNVPLPNLFSIENKYATLVKIYPSLRAEPDY